MIDRTARTAALRLGPLTDRCTPCDQHVPDHRCPTPAPARVEDLGWRRPCTATSEDQIPCSPRELARLRRRVRDLQDEVERFSAANDALTSLVAADHLAGLDRVELPADVSVTPASALTTV